MASINKVILVGHLGRDVESRYMPDGAMAANVSIATTSQWKDKNTGEKREETEWHRVSFFGRLAEIAAEYLRKGSQVYIEGRLRTRKWQDKETGQDRYTTEIVADVMQRLGSRQSNAAPAEDASRPHRGVGESNTARRGRSTAAAGSSGAPDLDDSIPF